MTVSYAQLIAIEERNKQTDEFRGQLSDIVSRLAALEAQRAYPWYPW